MSLWKERIRKTLQQRQQCSKSLLQNPIIQALNWMPPQRSHNHIGCHHRPGLSIFLMTPSLRWCQHPRRTSASPPRPSSWSWSRWRETEWAAWGPGRPQYVMLSLWLKQRDGDTRKNNYNLQLNKSNLNVNVITYIYEWFYDFMNDFVTLYCTL